MVPSARTGEPFRSVALGLVVGVGLLRLGVLIAADERSTRSYVLLFLVSASLVVHVARLRRAVAVRRSGGNPR